MKFNIERYRITIAPEDDRDVAYIETVLGLEKSGDYVVAERVNAIGLSCLAYIEMRRKEE